MSQKTVFIGSAFVVPGNHHACVIADDDEMRRDFVARFLGAKSFRRGRSRVDSNGQSNHGDGIDGGRIRGENFNRSREGRYRRRDAFVSHGGGLERCGEL